jgi:hypothetical protein
MGNEISNSFEPYGFVGLASYKSGARSIYNSAVVAEVYRKAQRDPAVAALIERIRRVE